MKKGLAVGLGVIALGIILHLAFGLFWFANAQKPLVLLSSESEPMDQTAILINGKPPPPPRVRGHLQTGERVFVAFDMYGKDYWTCLVFKKSGQHGWVLCTDLDRAKASKQAGG